jgi:polar amino acid transport system permease protein
MSTELAASSPREEPPRGRVARGGGPGVRERWEHAALSLPFRLRVGAVVVALGTAMLAVFSQFEFDYGFAADQAQFVAGGLGFTLLVTSASWVLAVALGLVGALGRLSTHALPYGLAASYTSLIRGTPLLVQLFLWYAALPELAPLAPAWAEGAFILPALAVGILALGVNYGAYFTETFRAGIESVPHGQLEAAYAMGMRRTQALRRVVLPQAFRNVVPVMGNDFINMIKDSSLVGLITVSEIFFRARQIGNQTFNNFEMLILVAAMYWLLCVCLTVVQRRLERRLATAYVR